MCKEATIAMKRIDRNSNSAVTSSNEVCVSMCCFVYSLPEGKQNNKIHGVSRYTLVYAAVLLSVPGSLIYELFNAYW